MKKSIVTLVFSLISMAVFSQTAFDKFDGQDGITALIVNKKMFQMMASVKVDANNKETQQYLDVIKKLDDLKAYTTSDTKQIAEFIAIAEKYAKTEGLEELMRANEGKENLKIWIKSGTTENQIKELLMVSEGVTKANETILLSLKGDIDLNDVAVLTDKMKIPGGADLKKATKSK